MTEAAEAGPSRTPPPRRKVYPTEAFVDGRGDVLAVRVFADEDTDLPGITRLCDEELSEPYNVYTFRYFLEDWPHLTFFVFPSPADPEPIATIICKLDMHRERTMRGYIGMLSVDKAWRRRSIARKLVELAISKMEAVGADEIVLETEFDNGPSLALYEALGFICEKRLHRFYSNGKDAFRLVRPLARHPLLRTAALRERQDAERRSMLENEKEENGSGDAVPPEIALVLAGPPASPPTAAHADAMARLASLTIESMPIRPPPSYIM
ncbi:hypothetical protein CcaverHIS002_0205220 [Cutaneotrichosporon cavernicola]|uniref:N-acetyltransferase domain-containing protein n=1 Tax=Cutaneotrichosporon cavernicola TaxID=279322 RepID=A0AA48I119_9TREE|nr:uncharacterized protein CcaverHIS019_0205180 [Cutaneotrichosporon cavernicola]BEI81362.1 hypothetical protein CcaverHIS002_0205220 [Cutaneotrichosporon cavernicola]BEI89156.1 hypothetical protein CcaverHIS019_0205180 [Cutaneotrichosporon cavernicola]BEI96933.1 hypothetical protein CcaverHIS631_0205220 [Cutaneotrichosporon cavernicola]BEJ04705.1 hypothetical protein CcaverHIS641_0205220 [Cutaneotrichosporon cavernicola]